MLKLLKAALNYRNDEENGGKRLAICSFRLFCLRCFSFFDPNGFLVVLPFDSMYLHKKEA